MSLWGNSDSLFSTGNIRKILLQRLLLLELEQLFLLLPLLEGAVVTTVLVRLSALVTNGTGLTNTTFSIINTTGLDGTAISGVAYNISEQPVYLNEDSNWDGDAPEFSV